MKVMAHRGYSGAYPENTMLSFREAVKVGCDAIEMDVHETRDGRLVVIHDERLERTTDGTGRICEHTFDELRQVNAAARYAGKYAPERIPSFDEYCEWASGESVGHNIEIKTDKIYYHDIERKIWATIERYGLEHKVMFSSFNHFSLRRILEISGNAVEVGALVLEDSIGGFPGYYCEQAGFACYHPPIELLTDENVRDCKEHGVKMNVWTVNDMAGLEQLHRWGCEGIITNYPGVASGWLRAQGFRTVAMALRDDSVPLNDPRLLAEERLAIVLGTEGDGLAQATIDACDYTVRIPMSHGVDSLNVAAASAVAFYQLGLQ